MRTLSPRIAPPVNGEDGSIASTATLRSCARKCPITALVSVLLPAPGAPVIPTVYALPLFGYVSRPIVRASSPPRSINDNKRASEPRSPFTALAKSAVGSVTRDATSYTATTSVTPSTRSRIIRSMPAFKVWSDAGHVPQAPTRVTFTIPVTSSTSCNTMSPPSAWSAGRMTSIVSSTCVRIVTEVLRFVCSPLRYGGACSSGWLGRNLAGCRADCHHRFGAVAGNTPGRSPSSRARKSCGFSVYERRVTRPPRAANLPTRSS